MAKKMHHYTLRRLEEIYDLSRLLCGYFTHPAEVMTGIYELLFNAVEHGSLGIGAEAKNRLLKQGKWKDEIAYRLALPQYTSKTVTITVIEDEEQCRLIIADEGQGFDWRDYLQRKIDILSLNGKGLQIALQAGFTHISFNEMGNVVTCIGSKAGL